MEGVAGEGVTEVALGVIEAEPLEGTVEALAHEGIEACGVGLSSSLLLSQPRSEPLLGLASLLLGDGLAVERDAALAATVRARAAVEGAREDERELGHTLGEEAEGALDVGRGLRPKRSCADAEGIVAEASSTASV